MEVGGSPSSTWLSNWIPGLESEFRKNLNFFIRRHVMSSKVKSATMDNEIGRDENPLSRREDLVVQELDGEVLIYDLGVNKAFCLNETSAMVWQACDGKNSVADIGRKIGNDDIVWLALSQLKKERLIAHDPNRASKFDGMSRREVVRKIGLGSMIALPLVSSLVAPKAIHAQSGLGACAPAACVCATTGMNGGTCASAACTGSCTMCSNLTGCNPAGMSCAGTCA
jgi:hypothetical protein